MEIEENENDESSESDIDATGSLLMCQAAGKVTDIWKVRSENEAAKRLKRRKKRRKEKAEKKEKEKGDADKTEWDKEEENEEQPVENKKERKSIFNGIWKGIKDTFADDIDEELFQRGLIPAQEGGQDER